MRIVGAVLLVASLIPAQASAQDCTPSRALLVVDKSSSMETGTIGGVTKWDITVAAIDQVLTSYESQAAFGLMTFPAAGECSPGVLDVTPAVSNRSAILSVLATPPPTAGNWTPMAQTLAAAGALSEMTTADAPRYVILLTDGWQWCSPYDPATRTAPVAPVDALTAAGVTVFVVGFGDSVDVSTLNTMAVHAGTALAGCDPTGDAVTDPNPCYYRADDPVTLVAALDAIALHVSAEVCDGLDNNCDGNIDEGLTQACESACGTGTETCDAGVWVGCDAPEPAREVCDNIDNDCDGEVDPGCACVTGVTRACGLGVGACVTGVQTCNNGQWGSCEGATNPSQEACDGVDNDCDGTVDNPTVVLCPTGFACTDGTCVAIDDPVEPPPGEVTGEAVGCGCRTGAGASPFAGLLALLGLALVRRRRG